MDNFSFKKIFLSTSIFFIFLLPIVLATLYQYKTASIYFDEMIKSRRETVAYLSASLIGEKFNVLKELITTYGLSRELRSQVIQKNWNGAIDIASEMIKTHPDIERTTIVDSKGTIMADRPTIIGSVGTNFAYRDWYTEVVKTNNTYFSDILKRKVKPTYNIVTLSTPINDFDNNLIGVLTIQIRVSRLTNWAKDFEFGQGLVYFVDKKGQVSGDPKFSELDETIPNFSNVPVVKKVLQGKQGIEIQNSQLIAYSPVKEYGWGVIAQESVAEAYKTRAKYLQTIIIFGFMLIISNVILIWLLLRKKNN